MKRLAILGMFLILGTAAFAQLPQEIDSTVINTPGALDRLIRTAFRRASVTVETMPLAVYPSASTFDTCTVVWPEPFADSEYAVVITPTFVSQSEGYASSVPSVMRFGGGDSVRIYIAVTDSVIGFVSGIGGD